MNSQEVLIVGAGEAGLATGAALAESGIASTLIEMSGTSGAREPGISGRHRDGKRSFLSEEAGSSGRVMLLGDTSLRAVSGAAGDFSCELHGPGGRRSARFGAIVLATGSARHNAGGLPGLDEVGDLPAGAGSVCLVLGRAGASTEAGARSALESACTLRRDRAVEVVVLYQQMKVAGAGLQSMYDDARALGVVFSRYENGLSVRRKGAFFEVEYAAQEVGEKVRLSCDAVFHEGEEAPSAGARELARILDVDMDEAGFFQGENVSLYPVGTRRRGVFAVGACRRPALPEEILLDSRCAAAQVCELFEVLGRGAPVAAPVVDKEKCAFCLTCMRACPHRAVGFDFENRAAKILENACFACGVCVGECPARAIRFEDTGARPGRSGAGLVGFLCRRSAAEALVKLSGTVPEMTVKEVACSGMVEVPEILGEFERGAAGVVIAGCHRGSCRSLTGSDYALKRVQRVKAFMQQAGMEPDRLMMTFVSDVEPEELGRALRSFAARVAELPGRSRGHDSRGTKTP